MPIRLAALCGIAAPLTFVVGVLLGDLAQPDAFSPADDDISDLGALTASSAWLYNQVAANLSGLLVVCLALGLWRALGPGRLARPGTIGLAVAGTGLLLDGFFRLDCQGIDTGCENTSWNASAHKVESGITAAAILVTPFVLAFAFRRLADWRSAWVPSLLVMPAVILSSAVFGVVGSGAATRAGSAVWFLWVGFLGLRLLHAAAGEGGQATVTPSSRNRSSGT